MVPYEKFYIGGVMPNPIKRGRRPRQSDVSFGRSRLEEPEDATPDRSRRST